MQFSFLTDWPVRSATLAAFASFASFVLAALAAGSAVYWALQWQDEQSLSLKPTVGITTTAPVDSAKMARLLGADPASRSLAASSAALVAAKYKLWGVIAHGNNGSALIAIDESPAKPYRVGDRVGDNLTLLSVQARSAALAPSLQASASITLNLPALLAASAASSAAK